MGDPTTKSVAKNLQTQQLHGWIKSGKSVDDAFTILKFARKDDGVIVSRKLDILEEFINLKGDGYLIGTLTKLFGGNSNLALILERASPTKKATMLQKRQFAEWVNAGVKPDNMMYTIWKTRTTNEQKSIADKYKAWTADMILNSE
ncbi:Secreted RxLR effector peptide protein [Phytophthora palmivora]|uniref:Secreted RxLR effector peptide protein n=1 Tax=Phytophthora palmivora TaxID=4796 RepID=A0A2P4YRH0_9STRA|nr:Secreted RxLR effector peptide protein [Phytophthora palmivora]